MIEDGGITFSWTGSAVALGAEELLALLEIGRDFVACSASILKDSLRG